MELLRANAVLPSAPILGSRQRLQSLSLRAHLWKENDVADGG